MGTKQAAGELQITDKVQFKTERYSPFTKTAKILILMLPILFLALVNPVHGSDIDNNAIKVYCNNQLIGCNAYIDSASGVCMAPLADIQSIPGLRLDVRDNKAWFALNGKELSSIVGSNTYTIYGQNKSWRCGIQPWPQHSGIAVPVRDLMSALGAGVRWDEHERAVYITALVAPKVVSQNLSDTSLPLHLAFIQDNQLWLLSASQPKAQPFLVPTPNIEQIVGWSHDGQWLAYLQNTDIKGYSGEIKLWVVASDGQHPRCLDEMSIAYSTPVWSPTEDTIAYQVQMDPSDPNNKSLRIANHTNGNWQYNELYKSVERPMGSGLAWFPDGHSLIISRVHDEKNLPQLDQVDLQGKIHNLYTLPADLAGDYNDGLYIYDINDLKFSPDGRYAACFLGMNSASMNADSMSLYLIDLQTGTAFEVGCALGYPEWVSWSGSRQLAVITGCDRTASTNKHLQVVKIMEKGLKIEDLSISGQVDSRPIWDTNNNALYFARGQESTDWLEEGRHQEVQVPGQKISCRRNEQVQNLSQPGEEMADYPLSLSPDSQYLAMQRLKYADLGTLYLFNLKDGQMIKLMEDIQANPGYYGNYIPDDISIYWHVQ